MTLVHYKSYSGQPHWHIFPSKDIANSFAKQKIERGMIVTIRPFNVKTDRALATNKFAKFY